MSKPKVFSTHPLFEAPRKMLDEHFEVDYWSRPERPPRAELLRRVADKEALVCLLTEKINDELLAAAPNLRIVANVAVGFDNIDVPACTRRRVVASNTPGVLDETTADFAWTLLMAIARRVLEGDQLVRSGQWTGWNLDQLCGGDVWGKTLGLLGFGRIGRAVARRTRGFQMRVIYNDAVRAPAEVEKESNVEFLERDQVLAEADFISVHVPLLPETRHLISAPQLARMIAGAALDVHEKEPQVHPGLMKRADVILTPHIASASVETRTRMAAIAAENVIAVFAGRRPPTALNPEVLGTK